MWTWRRGFEGPGAWKVEHPRAGRASPTNTNDRLRRCRHGPPGRSCDGPAAPCRRPCKRDRPGRPRSRNDRRSKRASPAFGGAGRPKHRRAVEGSRGRPSLDVACRDRITPCATGHRPKRIRSGARPAPRRAPRDFAHQTCPCAEVLGVGSINEPMSRRTGKIRVGLVSRTGSRSGVRRADALRVSGRKPGPDLRALATPGRSSYTPLMPRGCLTRSLGRAVSRVPGLRHVPLLKLFVAAEVALLARDHIMRLDRQERRRLVELARIGRGRRRNLSDAEREELAALMARMEPRLLAGHAVHKLLPLPLPRRLVYGPRKRR